MTGAAIEKIVSRFHSIPKDPRGGKVIVTLHGRDEMGKEFPVVIKLVFSGRNASRQVRFTRAYPDGTSRPFDFRMALRKQETRAGAGAANEGAPPSGPGPFDPGPFESREFHIDAYLLRGAQATAVVTRLGDRTTSIPIEPNDVLGVDVGLQTRVRFNARVVQDIRRLPEEGESPSDESISPTREFPDPEDERPQHTLFAALNRMIVSEMANGVDFHWPATGQSLQLILAAPCDGVSGFSYFVNPAPVYSVSMARDREFHDYDDLLHLQICGDVKISLSRPDSERMGSPFASRDFGDEPVFLDPVWSGRGRSASASTASAQLSGDATSTGGQPDPGRGPFPTEILRPTAESRFFRVQRVRSVAELAPPGAAFRVRPADDQAGKEYGRYLHSPPKVWNYYETLFDLTIGYIPILGDLVDIADFLLAWKTGKDKWGNEVSDLELAFMAVMTLPGVTSAGALARGARRAG